MDVTPVFIVAIIFSFTYKIFDLFVRRKERMTIIDKLNFNSPKNDIEISQKLISDISNGSNNKFTALKWGSLAIGMGAGLFSYGLFMLDSTIHDDWLLRSTLCSSLTLIGGGIGLIVAFLIENSMRKSEKE